MLAPIAEIIAGSETGDLAFLATQAGRPFTIAGFGNWFRDRCDEAGLKGTSAHGLRHPRGRGGRLVADAHDHVRMEVARARRTLHPQRRPQAPLGRRHGAACAACSHLSERWGKETEKSSKFIDYF